jgi:hypothetical protein
MRQIGPIVDKRTVRRQLDGYEDLEYPDRSGPDLYRAMQGYPRMGSGDWCGLQFRDPGSDCRALKERPRTNSRIIYLSGEALRYLFKGLRILIGVCCSFGARRFVTRSRLGKLLVYEARPDWWQAVFEY